MGRPLPGKPPGWANTVGVSVRKNSSAAVEKNVVRVAFI